MNQLSSSSMGARSGAFPGLVVLLEVALVRDTRHDRALTEAPTPSPAPVTVGLRRGAPTAQCCTSGHWKQRIGTRARGSVMWQRLPPQMIPGARERITDGGREVQGQLRLLRLVDGLHDTWKRRRRGAQTRRRQPRRPTARCSSDRKRIGPRIGAQSLRQFRRPTGP